MYIHLVKFTSYNIYYKKKKASNLLALTELSTHFYTMMTICTIGARENYYTRVDQTTLQASLRLRISRMLPDLLWCQTLRSSSL